MALKFLNKKGWHTGSLRNVENVWKAEQKHEAEQHKLEELRKQIQEERERAEFRLLQEQAGLVPRQERLDFLYESGLAVGKSSSEGFKALEAPSAQASAQPSATSSKAAEVVPGALFEDKPQSANDAWRKLHSDPLLLIRQREQEALARIKNNPIQMSVIRKSAEAEKKNKQEKKEKREKKRHKKKHRHGDSKNEKGSSRLHSDQDDTSEDVDRRRDRPTSEHHHHSKSENEKHSSKVHSDPEGISEDEDRRKRRRPTSERHQQRRSKPEMHLSRATSDLSDRNESEDERRKGHHRTYEQHQLHYSKNKKHSSQAYSFPKDATEDVEERKKRPHSMSHYNKDLKHENHSSRTHSDSKDTGEALEERRKRDQSASDHRRFSTSDFAVDNKHGDTHIKNYRKEYGYNHRQSAPRLSEEERAARLREMQLNAELHDEQRLKRLKKAAEAEAQEAVRAISSQRKNFLDDAQKSIYGTEKGGSSTIEESVRRRKYYSQGGRAASESNAFRR